MVKIFIGVVIDEDSKQVSADNTSYDIIGFALLSLDTLTISFVPKDGVNDRLKQDIWCIDSFPNEDSYKNTLYLMILLKTIDICRYLQKTG